MVTKREALVSVAIMFVMLLVGLFICSAIANHIEESNEQFYKAAKIQDADQFQYALKTSFGNALVYGEIKAVQPVSMPEISGEWYCIRKAREEYTRHTRTVTTTDSKGKSQTHTEVYWTWDEVDSNELKASGFELLGVAFSNPLHGIPEIRAELSELCTGNVQGNYLYDSKNVRYYFEIIPSTFYATIEAKIKQNQIASFNENLLIKTYYETSISQLIDNLENGEQTASAIFWVVWLIITAVAVYAFCRLENTWLEEN